MSYRAPPPPGSGSSGPDWRKGVLITLTLLLVGVLVAIGVVLLADDGPEATESLAVPTLPTETTVPPETSPATTAPSTAPSTTIAVTTTTVAVTTTTIAPTTTLDPQCAFLAGVEGPIDNFVFLDVDGLGGVEFGDNAEDVVQFLTCLLGEPDSDSGYVDSFSVFGTCPGTEVRGVRWGALLTLFGDTQLFGSEDREFYAWRYDEFELPDELGLTFPDTQIGLGSTISELEAAYGADVEVFEDEFIGGFAFSVGERPVGEITFSLIFGTLSEGPPSGRVQFLDVGFFCGE
ncbi:MAG: hypothetical protein OEM94_07245 [Acidimicrobiia bacterium]|nr:hypothetical protein [Acidimicrobiia bacterium]